MPSPFPGMDPYLESELWTSFHSSLATAIAVQLAPQLEPRYFALPVERFIFDVPDDVAIETSDIYPDVGTVAASNSTSDARTATVALVDPPLRLDTIMSSAVPHANVEVRDVRNRRLITAIEILSPTNKRGKGRRQYLSKRQNILSSSVHLMEIDLVRVGSRVPMQQPLPSTPYFVLLSRKQTRPTMDVWPIGFQQALPTIPVPLRRGDADVFLDLQMAVTQVYEQHRFNLAIDYSKPPDVRLPPDVETWADQLLRVAKLRK